MAAAKKNKHTGDVSFPANGKTWRLQYTVDSLVILEDRLDADVVTIAQRLSSAMRLGLARTVLWVGLLEHQPEVSEKEAGELIPFLGLKDATALIEQAFAAAFPQPSEAGGAPAGPPKARARAGTGRSS